MPPFSFRHGLRGLLAAVAPVSLLLVPGLAQASTVQNYTCTQGTQTATAPAGSVSAQVALYGAGGGSNSNNSASGGNGATLIVTMPVTGGEQFAVNVGCAPQGMSGGWNGGGNGGMNPDANGASGAGGGATDILPLGGTFAQAYAVAGGGGGGGDTDGATQDGLAGPGGGSAQAGTGGRIDDFDDGCTPGGGGQSGQAGGAGGAGGRGAVGPALAGGENGTALLGGLGGGGTGSGEGTPGGGGGGGWVGGGGGGPGASEMMSGCLGYPGGGGGGGGSDYVNTAAAVSQVSLTDGANAGNGSVSITYTVVPPASISVNQTSVAFGSSPLGQSTTVPVTVTNTGVQGLTIGQAALAGQNAGQFAIASDTCSGQTVSGGDTCTIGVQYNPTARGAQTAELDIPSNDANSPTLIDLSGTGESVSQPAQPTQPTQPVNPAQPTQPVNPAQPTQATQPALVERVSDLGQPEGAQQLMTRGEKLRVYCNQACSLNVNLEVYYRAVIRGTGYEKAVQGHVTRMQPWTRVVVGQAAIKLNHAGYEIVIVKVAGADRTVVKDAGSILLGLYTHNGGKLLSKRWLQVKGPDMNAKVQADER
jgi:hypothetical protein